MTRWQIKKQWFKRCSNPWWYKILVLLGIFKSPTLIVELAWWGKQTNKEKEASDEALGAIKKATEAFAKTAGEAERAAQAFEDFGKEGRGTDG